MHLTGHSSLLSTDTLEQLAKAVCAELGEGIFLHEEEVLARDVDAVHDMRVASRRLRVALSNFSVCFDSDRRRQMRARLGKLADALGGVRDLDVLIASLNQSKTSAAPDERKHIAALIRRLRARRLRRYRLLETFLRGEEYATLKDEFLSIMPPTHSPDPRSENQAGHGQSAQGEKDFAR